MNFEDILEIAQQALKRAYKKADHVYELCFQEELQTVLVKRFWLKGKNTEYLGELYFLPVKEVLARGHATSPALLRNMLRRIKQIVGTHMAQGESVSIKGLDYFSGFYIDGKVLEFAEVVHSSSENIESVLRL